jgi:hypothetical protein
VVLHQASLTEGRLGERSFGNKYRQRFSKGGRGNLRTSYGVEAGIDHNGPPRFGEEWKYSGAALQVVTILESQ